MKKQNPDDPKFFGKVRAGYVKITRPKKQRTGKLVWIFANQETIMAIGDFAFLSFKKKQLQQEPQYSKGTFKIQYI